MKCPYCESDNTRVIDTAHETTGPGIRRRRECNDCGKRFSTLERAILDTPMVVKSDGRREPFDRAKLMSSIRMACAKRPIASASLDSLVNQIEAKIQQTGKAEVSTKMIGDLVIAGLKTIDQVAYIRFATVYMGLDDLESVRREIDRILDR
ncbi:MAG: transcriptional regulator NrdR [Anaerolineae bacterium]